MKSAALALSLSLAVGCSATSSPTSPSATGSPTGSFSTGAAGLLSTGAEGAVAATLGGGNSFLAALRQATAAYHDVDKAVAAGYLQPSGIPCVASPAGTMGIHTANPALAARGVSAGFTRRLVEVHNEDSV